MGHVEGALKGRANRGAGTRPRFDAPAMGIAGSVWRAPTGRFLESALATWGYRPRLDSRLPSAGFWPGFMGVTLPDAFKHFNDKERHPKNLILTPMRSRGVKSTKVCNFTCPAS